MSELPGRRRRGRPPKKYARTPSDFNEIIFKVANSKRIVKTPTGDREISFFEANVIGTTSENPSVRIGATAFVNLTKRAAQEERNLEERLAREQRMSTRSGEMFRP